MEVCTHLVAMRSDSLFIRHLRFSDEHARSINLPINGLPFYASFQALRFFLVAKYPDVLMGMVYRIQDLGKFTGGKFY